MKDKPVYKSRKAAAPAPRKQAAPKTVAKSNARPLKRSTRRRSGADGDELVPASGGTRQIIAGCEHLFEILRRYPVGWFFVGLLLIFLANNTVHLQLGSGASSLTPPIDQTTKVVLELIGLTTIIAALTCAFKVLLTSPAARLFAGVLGLSGVGLFAWGATSKTGDAMVRWGYNVVTDDYFAEVNTATLARYHGWSAILVSRMLRDGVVEYDDKRIIVSKPIEVTTLCQGQPLLVSCKELNKPLAFGDRVQGTVFLVPPGVSIERASCINDFIGLGCHLYARTWNRVCVNEGTCEALHAGYKLLSEEAKKAFLSRIAAVSLPVTASNAPTGPDQNHP